MHGEDPQGRIIPLKVDMDGFVQAAWDSDTSQQRITTQYLQEDEPTSQSTSSAYPVATTVAGTLSGGVVGTLIGAFFL